MKFEIETHMEAHGLKSGFNYVSVDLSKLLQADGLTEAQIELLRTARDIVWRAEMIEAAKTREAA